MEELAPADAEVTEDDWSTARSRARRSGYLGAVAGVLMGGLLVLLTVFLATLTASGGARYPVTFVWFAVLAAPLAAALVARGFKQQEKSDGVIATLAGQFEAQARGQRFESRLANALDMAGGEAEVLGVIEQSFSSMLANSPTELLLADNSHAHLLRMATASPTKDR